MEWSADNEQAEARGLGKYPLGYTEGMRKFSAKIELLMQDGYELQADLGDGYMSKTWTMSISYAASSTAPIITVVLYVVGMKSTSSPNETGDALSRSYDLNVVKIIDNGQQLL